MATDTSKKNLIVSLEEAVQVTTQLPIAAASFVRQICSEQLTYSSEGLVELLEWTDRQIRDLSNGAAKMLLFFLIGLFREEVNIQEEVRSIGNVLKDSRYTDEALLNLAKCAAKRAKSDDPEKDHNRSRCKICGSFHRSSTWDESEVGLAGRTAEIADRVYRRAMMEYRVLRRDSVSHDDPFMRVACADAVPAAKEKLKQAKKHRRETMLQLAKSLFPNGKVSFVKGLGWLLATNRKELHQMRDLWQAVKVFVRLTREIPQLLIRPSGVSIEIGDSSDTHEVFAIEFDSIFEPYDTKRLSKREKQLFKLLNSFKGQELEQGSYDGTDEELSLEYFWGGGYDLKRLTEILGGTVRRSSKVFYSDEGVVIPTLVEMRNPEDMARCTKVLVQGKMKGIKRPSGCEETYLHNDPRPVGPGNSGLLYNRTLSEQAAKEVMLMCTGITYAYMSGEVIDLPDASKAVREPRPVKSQYFTDVMPGFSWAWKHRYWVTPVAQRFYNDVGIWLICQNLSSAEEKVTAIRLTGPDGSELRCDETLSSQGHLLTWRLHQIGKWVPDCLYTNEGRKRRKIHESNIKVSVVSSFEV